MSSLHSTGGSIDLIHVWIPVQRSVHHGDPPCLDGCGILSKPWLVASTSSLISLGRGCIELTQFV